MYLHKTISIKDIDLKNTTLFNDINEIHLSTNKTLLDEHIKLLIKRTRAVIYEHVDIDFDVHGEEHFSTSLSNLSIFENTIYLNVHIRSRYVYEEFITIPWELSEYQVIFDNLRHEYVILDDNVSSYHIIMIIDGRHDDVASLLYSQGFSGLVSGDDGRVVISDDIKGTSSASATIGFVNMVGQFIDCEMISVESTINSGK